MYVNYTEFKTECMVKYSKQEYSECTEEGPIMTYGTRVCVVVSCCQVIRWWLSNEPKRVAVLRVTEYCALL